MEAPLSPKELRREILKTRREITRVVIPNSTFYILVGTLLFVSSTILVFFFPEIRLVFIPVAFVVVLALGGTYAVKTLRAGERIAALQERLRALEEEEKESKKAHPPREDHPEG